MTLVYTDIHPRGFRNEEASAIRKPATADGLAIPATERVNWLLSQGCSQICQMWFPSTQTSFTTQMGRIYHRTSTNASRLLVVPLISHSSGSSPTFTFTPAGGAAVNIPFVGNILAAAPWGETTNLRAWQVPITPVDIAATGVVSHSVEWSNLRVRGVGVYELARDVMDSTSDTVMLHSDGTYAGMLADRHIVDDGTDDAGIPTLLSRIASARDATKRQGGGWWVSDSNAWSRTSTSWGNIANSALSTSDFYWPARSRQVREATTTVTNQLAVRARYNGTGTGTLRIVGGAQTVNFSSLTSSFAWYTDTININASAWDTLRPESRSTDATTAVEVTSVQWFE